MPPDPVSAVIAVFDLGGTWFRWGRYSPVEGLLDSQRLPAISHVSHPELSTEDLQRALTQFVVQRVCEMRSSGSCRLRLAGVALGAPINVHDDTVLGSGPLWGPLAKPFKLQARLLEAVPEVQWHVVNDIAALLAPYMEANSSFRKTLLITVSTGIGCRLYDHQTGRIPYDATYGVQGEIGHLPLTFELEGKIVNLQCECGGRNHLNAFASGRGIAHILKRLPALTSSFGTLFPDPPARWEMADDEYRSSAFKSELDRCNSLAIALLDALVMPLSRTLATALSLDPEIDRIVITGGVTQGLGEHYRSALQRTFLREGLYQISERDPRYLERRLHWEDADALGGLRGAGIYAEMISQSRAITGN